MIVETFRTRIAGDSSVVLVVTGARRPRRSDCTRCGARTVWERTRDLIAVFASGNAVIRSRRKVSEAEEYLGMNKCLVMVVIAAGSFTMGLPSSEPERRADEAQVSATMPSALAAGEYQVTIDEWEACVADGGCGGYKTSDVGWGRYTRPGRPQVKRGEGRRPQTQRGAALSALFTDHRRRRVHCRRRKDRA